jgi:tripeptide aminopeptidase
MKLNYDLLKELYLTFSPSFKEEKISLIVKRELRNIGIKFETLQDQIFSIKENKPLLCAHMDQVSDVPISKVVFYKDLVFGDGNIGADDKNGIWIILHLLKRYRDISFIFSTGEEYGCEIDDILEMNKEKLGEINYALLFDRRNGKDIIGVKNDYCNNDFQKDVEEIGKDFGYQSSLGLFSDGDMLSMYGIPCVNLSCGYYNSHSQKEFTDMEELENALWFGRKILSSLNKTYSRIESFRHTYRFKSYKSYSTPEYHYGNYHWGTSRIKKSMGEENVFCKKCKAAMKEDELIATNTDLYLCPYCFDTDIEYIDLADYDDKIECLLWCQKCRNYTPHVNEIDSVQVTCEICRKENDQKLLPYSTEIKEDPDLSYCPHCQEYVINYGDDLCCHCNSSLITEVFDYAY